MTKPSDYAKWAQAVDEALAFSTSLSILDFPKAPLASWWEQGLSAEAAALSILKLNAPTRERPWTLSTDPVRPRRA